MDASTHAESPHRPAPGEAPIRRLRLASGLTLFTYAGLHLLNHALGNVSVAAMEAGLRLQKFLWQGTGGTIVLYAALTTHFALGLWAFYQRRHFGWTRAEVTQLALGLSIPPMLANHLYVTRISLAVFGTEKGYAQELYSFWVASPNLGILQVSVLLVAWTHGCIGVNFWLRLKRFYPRAVPYLLCAAVVLPLLALLGFYQGGRTVLALASDPSWQAANLASGQIGLPAQNAALRHWRDLSVAACGGLFVLILLARGVRALRERRGAAIQVRYPSGRVVTVPRGFSVLEASRAARVPHASVCGGRGRCSTCRVRIIDGPPPPAASAGEAALLHAVSAGPGVRLACQYRPHGNVTVVPLLRPGPGVAALRHLPQRVQGEERFIAALVVDMRDSSRLAETRLPFDAVFIIDRFVAGIAQAVTASGGRVTHFTGDGLIATFGLACAPPLACRQALVALVGIARNMAALNALLHAEASEAIRFGAGLHGGVAVVGEIGLADTRVFTTLGDATNAAARLEELCKTYRCEAVVSEEVCALAGADLSGFALHETSLRGRSATLAVRAVPQAADLAAVLKAVAAS